ncbi:MAG: Fic family protein [Flavobacteriales bacterium]
MLLPSLEEFNQALEDFRSHYPLKEWTNEFSESVLNDFSFFSSRLEDPNLQYGDTIRFLNNEVVNTFRVDSFHAVSEHKAVLSELMKNLEHFELTEQSIQAIHRSLMSSPLAWETEFKPDLIGNYRNEPAMGSRQPFFVNKEYVPHYNLEIVMASWLPRWNNAFDEIDNLSNEKHIISRIAHFHNTFLNEIHPFADGNGRVCRIIIGAMLMRHNCPPVFPQILNDNDQKTYITTIIECEKANSDEPLITYLANGMSKYMRDRI